MTSRILSPAEAAALDGVASPFVAAAIAQARATYPDFDAWHPDAQLAATVSVAMQAILRPSVHAAAALNLDMAAYGAGLALGSAVAAAGGEYTAMVRRIVSGVEIGFTETHHAAFAMPTLGSRN